LNRNQAHILLVDDESDVVLVLKRGLEKAGLEVTAFLDPFEALSKFKAAMYDFLVLDIRMPKMDGFALYEKMLQIDGQARACFLTAYDVDYRNRFKTRFPNLELDCFLNKPVAISALVKKVRVELGI
jgi:CheY-like chemotaxis protein